MRSKTGRLVSIDRFHSLETLNSARHPMRNSSRVLRVWIRVMPEALTARNRVVGSGSCSMQALVEE